MASIPLKAPRGGTPPANHSVSTSPIAARTRKQRHSRQMSCGSARSRPLFAYEWPNDVGQVGGKVFATQKGLQASLATSKTSENRAWTLPNRALGPPKSSPEPSKTTFFNTSNLRKQKKSCAKTLGGHFEPTWLQFGGPRPSKIEAKTRKN